MVQSIMHLLCAWVPSDLFVTSLMRWAYLHLLFPLSLVNGIVLRAKVKCVSEWLEILDRKEGICFFYFPGIDLRAF